MHKIHKNSKILTNERRVPGKKNPMWLIIHTSEAQVRNVLFQKQTPYCQGLYMNGLRFYPPSNLYNTQVVN